MILKPCNKTGCKAVIPQGQKYCKDHQYIEDEYRRRRYQDYDTKRKNDPEKFKYVEFYHSKEWTALRDYIMAKYNGICLYSLFIYNLFVPATTVHHVYYLEDRWDLKLDEGNLIPVSYSVHQLIHTQHKEQMQQVLFGLLERWKKEYKLD